jgi:CheY-like chemotaxis protein
MINLKPIILVVDDDPNDLFFIRAAFAIVGLRTHIHTADSGHKAIAYLKGTDSFGDRQAHPLPDFVITDLKMPDGDGFSVLKFLQDHPGSGASRRSCSPARRTMTTSRKPTCSGRVPIM